MMDYSDVSSSYGYCGSCHRIPRVIESRGRIIIYVLDGFTYSYEVSVNKWIKIEIIRFEDLAIDEEVKNYSFLL